MPFTQTSVAFGAPNTTRGTPFAVSTDNAGKFIAYGCGMNVVVRPLAAAANAAETMKDTVLCTRHTAVVTCVRMSPHGTFIASGDIEGNVIIWANRGDAVEKLKFKPMSGPIRDMSWSDDQERIAVVGDGRSGFAGVFAVSGGNTIGSLNGHTKAVVSCDFKKTRPFRIVTGGTEGNAGFFEGPPFKFAHFVSGCFTGNVNCVRYNNDGSLIAVVSGAKDVIILDGKDGQKVRSFTTDHSGSLWSVAWSADGAKIATVSGDKAVKVWSAADGTKVGEYVMAKDVATAAGPSAQQCGATYLPDGTLITVTLGADVMFFDADLKVTRTLKGHSRPVNGLVATAADGSAIVTTADDGKVLAWSGASGALTATTGAQFTGSQEVLLYASAPIAGEEGAIVALANDDLAKIYTKTGDIKKLAQHTGGATAIAYVAKANVIAVLQKASMTLYNGATGEKLKQVGAAEGLGKECGALATVGDLLAVGMEKQVKVFSVSTAGGLTEVATYAGVHGSGSGGNVTTIAFSADGTLIASGDSNRQLAVWKATDASVVRDNMCFHASRVASVSFSAADNTTMVSGGLDGTLYAWDLTEGNNGKKAHIDAAHRGGVTRVATIGAKEVISTGADATIKRWRFEF